MKSVKISLQMAQNVKEFVKVVQDGTFGKILIKYNPERTEEEFIGDFGELE